MTPRARRVALLLAGLSFGLATPLTAFAQDEGKPGLVEEDLGNGFRAVGYGDGPPAIIDDETGLILKDVGGRLAVVDPKTTAILYEGSEEVEFYGKGKGGTPAQLDAQLRERMGTLMGLAKKLPGLRERLIDGDEGQGKGDRKSKDTKKKSKKSNKELSPEGLAKALMQLLGASEEEQAVILPLLEGVLVKQDEIRRSRLDLSSKGKPRPAKGGSKGLPAAVAAFLRLARQKEVAAEPAKLAEALAAYRGARALQHKELAALRERLREVLTVPQEARLVSVGVLD